MHRDLLRYRVESHQRWQYDLTLMMSPDEATRLAAWIEPATQGRERSLALPHSGAAPLPGSWRLIFKTRDSESRMLLAHPAAEEWVATFALEAPVMDTFLADLRGGRSGRLDALTRPGAMSNVHLSYEIQ